METPRAAPPTRRRLARVAALAAAPLVALLPGARESLTFTGNTIPTAALECVVNPADSKIVCKGTPGWDEPGIFDPEAIMARKIARADKERPGGPPEGADERLEEAEAAIEKLRPPYNPLGTDNVMRRRQRVAFGNDGKFRWPEGVQNLWVENKVKWLKSLKGKFVPRGAKPWDPPKFKFVCVNVRLSAKQSSNTKIVNQVVDEMRRITGRHPFFNRCSVNSQHTGFRAGQICGVSVRLSGKLMNDFMNRLNTIVLPRVRDFEGLWPNSFTNHGDYWFSLPDQECFRELDEVLDQREITHPIDIGIVNNRFTQPDGLKMMKDFGFPFRDDLKPPRGWVHNPRVFRGKKPKMEKGRTGMHKKSR